MQSIEEILSSRGYSVTPDGIFLNPRKQEIGKNLNSSGYYCSCIRVDGKSKTVAAHRLQAYQKYKHCLHEEGMVVRHLDGNPLNNSWDNISIGTQSDNMQDIPSGIRLEKALYATSFVRKYDREKVSKFYKSCNSYKDTMEKFGITSKGTLHFILNGNNKTGKQT